MPGWFTVKDRDGNVFFMDKNLKLYPSDESDVSFKAVSKGGIQFCLAQSDELLRIHDKPGALRLLKSVRYLSDLDGRIPESGASAAKKIAVLRSREKTRYQQLDHQAALTLVRTDDGTAHLINDWMNYSFVSGGEISLMKRRIKEQNHYALDSSLFGISFSALKDIQKGYDAVLSVTAEEFQYVIADITHFEMLYRNKTPDDSYRREKISESLISVLYRWSGGGPELYEGYELLLLQGKCGYAVRVTCPGGKKENDLPMRKLIDAFTAAGRTADQPFLP